MIELACPENCPYLIDARISAGKRERELRAKEATTVSASNLALSDRALIALERIEHAIVNTQRGIGAPPIRDLQDSEILAAVENSIKNLETEETGLIYEHRAETPRINELSSRMRDSLSKFEELPPESRPRRSEIIKALSFTRESVRAHLKRAARDPAEARSYFRYISLFYQWPEDATRSLII